MSINIQNLIIAVDAKLASQSSNTPIDEVLKLQQLRNDLISSTGVLEYQSAGELPEANSDNIGKLAYVKDNNEYFIDNYGAFYFGTSSGWQSLQMTTEFGVGVVGGHLYTTSTADAQETYSWTCPAGITSVSVVCVGGGGAGQVYTTYSSGGGGGGLGWKNNITVVPGNTYTVVVGGGGSKKTVSNTTQANSGLDSYFIDTSTVKGGGGQGGTYNANNVANISQGGTYVGDGGGNGGNGGQTGTLNYACGAGGAGGYSGDGGHGGSYNQAGNDGQGGGGGGGGGGGSADLSGGGGGVGIYGEGTSGAGGAGSTADGFPGLGGSGGADGTAGTTNVPSNGGLYRGGGGAADQGTVTECGAGGHGAVRIIWGKTVFGIARAFPSSGGDQQGTEDLN